MSNLEYLENWFEKVWHEPNPMAAYELMLHTGSVEGLGEHTRVGPSDFEYFANGLLSMLRDIHIKIDKSIEDGDWISAMISVTATSKWDGRDITFTGQVTARFEDGKVAEGYNSLDFLSMYSQLGLLPENAFEVCFAGERVG